MTQLTPFVIIHPAPRESEDFILLVPTKIWKRSVDPLYKPLEASYVVRTQIAWGPDGQYRYMWVEEDAQMKAKPINQKATFLHAQVRGHREFFAGIVAIEGKPFDPDKLAQFDVDGEFIREQFSYLASCFPGGPKHLPITHYDGPGIETLKEIKHEQR